MNLIGATLVDTLVSNAPKNNDSVERWIVISVISVFLMLFIYLVVRDKQKEKAQVKHDDSMLKMLDAYMAHFTTILIAAQNNKIYFLNLSDAVGIFKAVLKGHCYHKCDMLVKSVHDETLNETNRRKAVDYKFKELTQQEATLLNKITYHGGEYLGKPIEIFLSDYWDAFMDEIETLMIKYWRSKKTEELRQEAFNMMQDKVELLVDLIMEDVIYKPTD